MALKRTPLCRTRGSVREQGNAFGDDAYLVVTGPADSASSLRGQELDNLRFAVGLPRTSKLEKVGVKQRVKRRPILTHLESMKRFFEPLEVL